MKKFLIIPVLLVLMVLISCDKENEIPKVAILTPTDNTMVMKGDVVTFEIEASDEDGALTKVELLINGDEVIELSSPPLIYEWHTDTLEAGGYNIFARAVDNDGSDASVILTININVPGGLNPELEYGSMSDYDGNSYSTIIIGEQTWMAEDLKVRHYSDGTPIAEVLGDENWAALSDEGAYCWYDDHVAYADTFGALYNWHAAVDTAGLCPSGWHLPSDEEWQQMEMALGMSAESAGINDWRGSNEGGFLKEVGYTHWEIYNDSATNLSGFTALPGGFRNHNGSFSGAGTYATYWTASSLEVGTGVYYRALHHERGGVYRHSNRSSQAFSVRCVKD